MSSKNYFEVNELVWAKMASYPPWPARITSPPNPKNIKKDKQYVYFFGTRNYAWISNDKIERHSEEILRNLNIKKKYNGFLEGIEEFKEEIKKSPKKIKESKEIISIEKKESKSPNKIVKINFDKSKKSPIASKISNLWEKKIKKRRSTSEDDQKPPKKRRSTSEDDQKSPKKQRLADEDSKIVVSNNTSGYDALFESVLPSIGHEQYLSMTPPNDPNNASGLNGKKDSKKVGFLGIGLMGSGMVKNLLDAGYEVVMWNRTIIKCDDFLSRGGRRVASPADVIRECDVTFCCVSDPHAVRTIVFGENGVLMGLGDNVVNNKKGYVEMTTIDSSTSIELADAITNKGMRYLEAPIIGSKKSADEGTILILGSGDRLLFNECEAYFHAMSKHAYYISCAVGKSANINVITSTFLGVMYAALAEVMSLIERTSLPGIDFLEILDLRGMSTSSLIQKGNSFLKRKNAIETFLKHQEKDMNLCLRLSENLDHPTPIISAAHEMYVRSVGLGCSDYDTSSVYYAYKY